MWFRKKYIGLRLNKYTIVRQIGEGRYGTCFLAISDSGDTVVIKKFKPAIFIKNAEKNAYEAVILSKLSDKRIPEFLGVVNEKGFYGFVLEHKEGYTIKDMIFKQNHGFGQNEIFSIGSQLISIIKYLHSNGIVHRDIRIPNVLIHNGEVYLVDFGLSRFRDGKAYEYSLDYSYLGDFLLYLIYSTYKKPDGQKSSAWYDELSLSGEQKLFLKKLLGLKSVYESIYDIEEAFKIAFCSNNICNYDMIDLANQKV